MDTRLEQLLIETFTTNKTQVVLSSSDDQTVLEAVSAVADSRLTSELHTTIMQTPLFADLVPGLLRRLWDNQVKYGSGDPFDVLLWAEDLEEEDLEAFSYNHTVQKALLHLVPLSKKREERSALLIDAYCVGDGCTPAELRELGLSRSLSRQDQLDLLIVLLRETTWPHHVYAAFEGTLPDLGPKPRLIILVDCLQYVTHCPPLDITQYSEALTYLVDELGDGVTLWLNINDDDPTYPAVVRSALGDRFLGIITHDLTREEETVGSR